MTAEKRKRLTLAATILGSAMVFVDGTVVNVALPAIRSDLSAGLATQQWVVEAYLLTLGSLILVGGSLGDLYGRRRVFAAGVAGFGATSLLCGAAPNAELLAAGRALQGIAGALLVPSSLAIITSTFSADERAAAIGTWTAATSAAIAVGPPLGGVLVDAISWRVIFLFNLPFVVATLWLILRAVPESTVDRGRRPDWTGAALCALGLGGPVLALIEQPVHGWASAVVLAPGLAGLALLGAFVAWERRARDPMMPLGLFAERNFAVGNATTFVVWGALGAAMFFLSLFLQQVAGFSALKAGLSLTPLTVMILAFSRRFGAVADRIGPRWFMTAGPLVAGAGMLGFLRVGADADYLGAVLPAVLVFGLGMSLTVAPLTAAVLSAVEDRNAGIASGVNNAIARIAGLVAIAAVGTVVSARFISTVDARLAGRPLDAGARSVVADARTRPLGGSSLVRAAPAERPVLRAAFDAGSVDAFHLGVLIAGLAAMLGGLVAGVGVRNPERRTSPQSGSA
jgi:EmrB/QacA subfamily drug resistance transporter